MTVYIVELGEYSDRYVAGVYSSEANAKLAFPGGDITPCDLDQGLDMVQAGLLPYSVQMFRDGHVESASNTQNMAMSKEPYARVVQRQWGRDRRDVLCVSLWAKDRAHAIKAANERRAHIIAAGEWP